MDQTIQGVGSFRRDSQTRGAGGEETFGGLLFPEIGVDEDDAMLTDRFVAGRRRLPTLMPMVGSLNDLVDPSKLGGILVDAVHGTRAQRAHRELVLAFPAHHDHGRWVPPRT